MSKPQRSVDRQDSTSSLLRSIRGDASARSFSPRGVVRCVGLPSHTYERWKVGDSGSIDENLAARLSLLMRIHTRLRSLFKCPERGYAWICEANDAFGGLSPAEIMGEGDIWSLARVRSYLEAEHNGW